MRWSQLPELTDTILVDTTRSCTGSYDLRNLNSSPAQVCCIISSCPPFIHHERAFALVNFFFFFFMLRPLGLVIYAVRRVFGFPFITTSFSHLFSSEPCWTPRFVYSLWWCTQTKTTKEGHGWNLYYDSWVRMCVMCNLSELTLETCERVKAKER